MSGCTKDPLSDWLLTQNVKLVSRKTLSGGSVSTVERLQLSNQSTVVAKSAKLNTPPDQFPTERLALETLRVPVGPRVPEILHVSPHLLVLEDLLTGPPKPLDGERFGRMVAAVHQTSSPAFGFEKNGYLGSTLLPNAWMADGHDFFVERRLLPLLRLCRDDGLLSPVEAAWGERMAHRLRELLPKASASLLHGDLWIGNVLSDSAGRPCWIDPFTHYGWAETDIAMTFLFGGFPKIFHSAWEEFALPETGWRDRIKIHNLVHLLNHLHLFGASYHGKVVDLLQHYGD